MKTYISRALVLLSVVSAVWAAAWAQTPGSSPAAPAPAGAVVSGIIECGEGYTSHELYDMKIKVAEVLRGEEAWKRLREASESNRPAPAGFDYVLARIRFEYYARGIPGQCVHQLAPEQFKAYSAAGDEYKPAPPAPPKPELRKALKSGESMEGWVVFSVAHSDEAPLMLYSADVGGAVMHGGGKWFLLR